MKQFLQDVQIKLQERLGSDYEVRPQLVIKNNSVEKHGFSIIHKDENVSPTIYMEYYFQEYKNGMSIDELVTDIISAYRHNAINEKIDIAKLFSDTATFGLKIVSKKSNEELLKTVPYQTVIDDYVVIPLLYVSEKPFESATITVKRELMDMIVNYYSFNSDEDFFAIARSNEKAKGFIISNMLEILKSMMSDMEFDEYMYEDCNMYVITNNNKNFGAIALCFTDLLDEVAYKFDSHEMIILPSSIHELICVEGTEQDMTRMKEMVREVNKTEVSEEEVLGSTVICYNADTKEFKTL